MPPFCTWVETVIRYEDGSQDIKEMYLPIDESTYIDYTDNFIQCFYNDSDFSGEFMDPLSIIIKEYGYPLLYEKGKWLCTQKGVERVKAKCKNCSIPFEFMKILFIYKMLRGEYINSPV